MISLDLASVILQKDIESINSDLYNITYYERNDYVLKNKFTSDFLIDVIEWLIKKR